MYTERGRYWVHTPFFYPLGAVMIRGGMLNGQSWVVFERKTKQLETTGNQSLGETPNVHH